MTNQEIKNITLESLRDWFKKEKWVRISTSDNFVTEDGTVENWGGMSSKKRDELLEGIKDYAQYIREKA